MNTEAKNMSVGTGALLSKQRDSNIELFRIITMLLIVAHHYVANSGLMETDGVLFSNPLSWRSLFLLVFGAWGKIGINCFVLITGYFMCKSQITAKKFFKLFFEVMFYRIIISSIFWLTRYEQFSLKSFVKTVIPIYNISDGFTSAFLIFYLCIPFLCILVNHLSERQHIRLLVLSSFTYVFLASIPMFTVRMNYVSWFIVLFFVASYIRLYPKKFFLNTKKWGVFSILCIVLCVASVIISTWFGMYIGRNESKISYFFVMDSNKILAFISSICFFMFFKNIRIRYSQFINRIAMSTFGVLLIHANSYTMRQWLWKDTLRNVDFYSSNLMPMHAIGSVIGIFIVCVCIDQVRIILIEKLFFSFWDKHWSKIQCKYMRVEDKIIEKISKQ